jgi:hypothetical protein
MATATAVMNEGSSMPGTVHSFDGDGGRDVRTTKVMAPHRGNEGADGHLAGTTRINDTGDGVPEPSVGRLPGPSLTIGLTHYGRQSAISRPCSVQQYHPTHANHHQGRPVESTRVSERT